MKCPVSALQSWEAVVLNMLNWRVNICETDVGWDLDWSDFLESFFGKI
jgi:hypothetical protein